MEEAVELNGLEFVMDNKKLLYSGAALLCGFFSARQALTAKVALPAEYAASAIRSQLAVSPFSTKKI